MKNWRFRPISRFISKTVQHTAIVTMEDHALTADSFAVSCIGLGWVHIFRFAMGWVRLGHSVDGWGHRKCTHGQLWSRLLTTVLTIKMTMRTLHKVYIIISFLIIYLLLFVINHLWLLICQWRRKRYNKPVSRPPNIAVNASKVETTTSFKSLSHWNIL